jgi:hypothetical protein
MQGGAIKGLGGAIALRQCQHIPLVSIAGLRLRSALVASTFRWLSVAVGPWPSRWVATTQPVLLKTTEHPLSKLTKIANCT